MCSAHLRRRFPKKFFYFCHFISPPSSFAFATSEKAWQPFHHHNILAFCSHFSHLLFISAFFLLPFRYCCYLQYSLVIEGYISFSIFFLFPNMRCSKNSIISKFYNFYSHPLRHRHVSVDKHIDAKVRLMGLW